MDLDPLRLPFPDEVAFREAFGDEAWNEFVGRTINTQAFFQLRQGRLDIRRTAFYDEVGEDNGWIMLMAKYLDEIQLIKTGKLHGSWAPGTEEAAKEYVWHCTRRITEIQGLDVVNRLFMQAQ